MMSRCAPITTLTAHMCRRMSAAATMQRIANVPSLATEFATKGNSASEQKALEDVAERHQRERGRQDQHEPAEPKLLGGQGDVLERLVQVEGFVIPAAALAALRS